MTLTVPLAMLNQIPAARSEWLVPGLLEEKVTALLKTVPQKHRHRLQPIGHSAADFMALFEAGELDCNEALIRALQRFVEERVSLKLPMESFRPENLNPHCFMNFRVQDEHGRVLAQSRNLAELRARFHGQIAAAFQAAGVKGVAEEPAPNTTSFPRTRESRFRQPKWIPAGAGMTAKERAVWFSTPASPPGPSANCPNSSK